MKYIAALLLSLSLTACTCLPKKEVVEVKVPVVQDFPRPPVVEKPNLEVDALTQEDFDAKNYAKISKAMTVTIQQLLDYSTKLEAYLDVYHVPETEK